MFRTENYTAVLRILLIESIYSYYSKYYRKMALFLQLWPYNKVNNLSTISEFNFFKDFYDVKLLLIQLIQ